MAGLYPQYSEKDFKCTPFGEGKVYKALQDQLGDSFLIFHALSWIYKEKGSNTQDYEADFVVFHAAKSAPACPEHPKHKQSAAKACEKEGKSGR